MKKVEAIVRTVALGGIMKSLEGRGIKGMTIYEVKGIGEQVQLYYSYTIHNRIEIIVPDDKVDEVVKVILDQAHTGLAGDGLIAVYPLDYMIKIRTKERFEQNE